MKFSWVAWLLEVVTDLQLMIDKYDNKNCTVIKEKKQRVVDGKRVGVNLLLTEH